VTDNRIAGLVFALSVLAVVSFLAARDLLRAPPTIVAPSVLAARATPAPAALGDATDAAIRADRRLLFPVKGYEARLRDNFHESRGKRRHEALDIMAPRGTPVVAVDDGRIARLYRSGPGGIAVYQFDAAGERIYYYAHLDGYAPGIAEGQLVTRGDVLGFVGSTGNAPASAPHLHFAMFETGGERRWWRGKAINPYPFFREAVDQVK
jgi:murein DD-endopeptidase MepM/ murein hydrolase activator NlpD